VRYPALIAAALLLAACGDQPAESDLAAAVAGASAARYAREKATMDVTVGQRGAAAALGAPPELVGFRKRRCREVSLGPGAAAPTGFECAVSVRFRNDGWIEQTIVVAFVEGNWRVEQ